MPIRILERIDFPSFERLRKRQVIGCRIENQIRMAGGNLNRFAPRVRQLERNRVFISGHHSAATALKDHLHSTNSFLCRHHRARNSDRDAARFRSRVRVTHLHQVCDGLHLLSKARKSINA